jgi:hypothetical protein
MEAADQNQEQYELQSTMDSLKTLPPGERVEAMMAAYIVAIGHSVYQRTEQHE